MPVLNPSADPVEENVPEGLVEAGSYATHADAFQHSLVVLAMGSAAWLAEEGPRHRLLVETAALPAAREQLARFDRESTRWPPAPFTDAPALAQAEVLTPLLWSAGLLAFFSFQMRHPEWVRWGAMDAEAVFGRGEIWRAATALLLHGDAAHVVSNALGGIFVLSALLTTVGRLRGWLLLGLASVAGNLAVGAVNYGREYRSLGASTALFAALGLLTGRAVRVVARASGPRRWTAMLLPAAAGFVMLALYGAGGTQVDVPAHFTGFVAGLVLGFFAGVPRNREPKAA